MTGFDPSIPVEGSWTPPSDWYTQPNVYTAERKSVFGTNWLVAARTEQLTTVGAYVAGFVAGEPYVVVRGADNELRAFSNVCRHNATPVATGCGIAHHLQCPYHGWTYSLTGRLTKAPNIAGIQDFERAEMSLPSLAVCTWGPLVLINFADSNPVFNPAELTQQLSESQWESLNFHSRKTYILDCNWKVFVDNYLDGGYHVPFLHKGLAANIDMTDYQTRTYDTFSIQSVRGNPSAERLAGTAIYAYVYPNLMLNRYGDTLDINIVSPLGESRCQVDFDWYFAPGLSEETIRQNVQASEQVQDEDIQVCESVQIGLGSAHYERGRYAPRVEFAKHHFHCMVAKDLA